MNVVPLKNILTRWMFWHNPWIYSTANQNEVVIAYRVRRTEDGDKYFDGIEIDDVQD